MQEPTENTPPQLFRYEEVEHLGDVAIVEYRYHVIGETPCFYVIDLLTSIFPRDIVIERDANLKHKIKYVSKTARARLAYPTRKEAMQSFIIRKYRQIGHKEKELEIAKRALTNAEHKYNEVVGETEPGIIGTQKSINNFPWKPVM